MNILLGAHGILIRKMLKMMVGSCMNYKDGKDLFEKFAQSGVGSSLSMGSWADIIGITRILKVGIKWQWGT